MRLAVLARAHRRPARAFIALCQFVLRARMDPVAVTAMHRPGFWGKPFLALAARVLRGPSFWTAAEREYMAAEVSRRNDCTFCARIHTETTHVESHGRLGTGAALRPELTAVLPLLVKLTTDPDSVTRADMAPVRAAGVPDDAVVDALHVMFLFNEVNRMANAFGWRWDSDRHVVVAAKVIHRVSYKLPGFALR